MVYFLILFIDFIFYFLSSDIYKNKVLFPSLLELDRTSETIQELINEELWILNSLQSRIQVIFIYNSYKNKFTYY